jgi:methyltransferase-like protein/cyclopropane fatty-acyl-phospholipid synthase-like methyltransferase
LGPVDQQGGLAAAYDAVAYPGYAYAQTHPDRLATQARLFGLRPAPVDRCRVLEIGCGDGGNLIPMALGLPEAEFVGVDLAAAPVARGTALARELGADNVRLAQHDVQALPAELGAFDYVLAHGVYSWIPPKPRDALMAACAAHLAPDGVAYVSYNAYPGSYLRDMARDVMLFHVRHLDDPVKRVGQARSLMEMIVAANADTPYARALRDHMERLLAHRDWALFHDDLAAVNTPVYFHEFMEHAGRHGLQFLAEASLSQSHLPEVPVEVSEALNALPDDVVLREQYMDFVRNRMFRETLLCHADRRLERTISPEMLVGMWIASPVRAAQDEVEPGAATIFHGPRGSSVETADPLLQRTLTILGKSWPQAVAFEDLVERARLTAGRNRSIAEDRRRLGVVLLRAAAGSLVELHVHPPRPARRPGARPVASPLARLQAGRGDEAVTSLRHNSVRIEDPLAAFLLARLDGSRDRAALCDDVRAFVAAGGLEPSAGVSAPPDEELPAALDAALARLAELALLCE